MVKVLLQMAKLADMTAWSAKESPKTDPMSLLGDIIIEVIPYSMFQSYWQAFLPFRSTRFNFSRAGRSG
jgi:hypothetical protein